MPTAKVNGTRIHYLSVGSGIPILCIHPPSMSGACFAYLRDRLSDRFQVITFDIRGHGKSIHSKQKVTISLIAEDIRQLMDTLHLPKAYLCGYSSGGYVALDAMLCHPDRFLGSILISAMPEMNDWYNRSRFWMAIQILRLRGKRLLAAMIAAGNADSLQTFKNLYRHGKQGSLRNRLQYLTSCLHYSCTKRLGEIQMPVQLIFGQKDRSFHRYARMLQRRLPHNTLQFIPNGKHQLPTKNPEELQAIIRSWIANIEAGLEQEEPQASPEPEVQPLWQQHSETHQEHSHPLP